MKSLLVLVMQSWKSMTGLPDFSSTRCQQIFWGKKTNTERVKQIWDKNKNSYYNIYCKSAECVLPPFVVCSRTVVPISSTHQRWWECQASHWGFQLVHRWRDTFGTVRHQWLDLYFELFLAVLVVLWVARREKMFSFGSWWTLVKDKVE